jgi:hypothetical protein
MFRIELYQRPLGPERAQRLVDESVTEMTERPDAVDYIKDHIARYDHSGYDGEQDSWWCRNDSDEVVRVFVIRAT